MEATRLSLSRDDDANKNYAVWAYEEAVSRAQKESTLAQAVRDEDRKLYYERRDMAREWRKMAREQYRILKEVDEFEDF